MDFGPANQMAQFSEPLRSAPVPTKLSHLWSRGILRFVSEQSDPRHSHDIVQRRDAIVHLYPVAKLPGAGRGCRVGAAAVTMGQPLA